MSVPLIQSLATTEALADVFSDESILQAMLDFEIALARVEARMGIIPQRAADAIAANVESDTFDLPQLSRDTMRAGTPTIPFVKALTELVRTKDAAAAGFVHWGATSQDVSDTALILLLKRARSYIESDLQRAEFALSTLSDEHKSVAMLGRTLLQPAPPITFGLKAAGWAGAIRRGRERVSHAFDEALVVQFGGASGTLAALGDQGIKVAQDLATDLKLATPDAPWHTHRDRLASLMCACGVVAGSIGKIARDISLLMQAEVNEAAEPSSPGRGGSSTMPHKRNPIGCAVTLAATNRLPGLVASFLSSMSQEHERAVGGIQSEWITVADIVRSTGLAASSIAEIAEGLTIDTDRMRENLEATRGTVFAEKVMIVLGEKIGRDKAHHLLEDATRRAITTDRHLADVLAETSEIATHLDSAALQSMFVAENYLGSAEEFRRRLLTSTRSTDKKD
jgi:3-carboxy-cis,cis-muconate cycloisomerase